uniref:Uncharacterized protein n=1 Tax=uncultured marine virus TaxID=186617 RepID=A0A0F7L5N4_9VIRU|nr:hypothetical protein [uncultured marine virus]
MECHVDMTSTDPARTSVKALEVGLCCLQRPLPDPLVSALGALQPPPHDFNLTLQAEPVGLEAALEGDGAGEGVGVVGHGGSVFVVRRQYGWPETLLLIHSTFPAWSATCP